MRECPRPPVVSSVDTQKDVAQYVVKLAGAYQRCDEIHKATVKIIDQSGAVNQK